MKHPEKAAFYSLLISTVCVGLINLCSLLDYLETGDPGSTFSNICYATGALCILFAWVQHFRSQKNKGEFYENRTDL